MGRFIKGEVVVLPFPFSDLSGSKRRPALVVVPLMGDDVILCMITSVHKFDSDSIPLVEADFLKGKLQKPSNIRPNRLFTADARLILYSAGQLKVSKTAEVINKLVRIIQS